MAITIRSPEPEEYRAAAAVASTALMFGPTSDDDWPRSEPSWQAGDSLVAVDGDRFVAHVGGHRFHSVVPGGATVPTSGVTRAGVLPTHTRRGLLAGMLRQLLTEARDRGQVVAALRASQAGIYGRFGFGIAGHGAGVEIDTNLARPMNAPSVEGSLRLLARDEILSVVPAAYERCIARRPGALVRPGWMWERYLHSALPESNDASHVVVHRSADGIDDGFCHYDLSWLEEFGQEPVGAAEVSDLWGATPDVEAALWGHVVGLDLVRRIRAEERPVDDTVRWMLANPRGYQVREIYDEQWVRLLDVDAALRARTFADGPAVTIRVQDPWFPEQDGTWRISGEGAALLADATESADADLAVGIAELSATYLGGTSWHDLWVTGRVDERRPGAVADAHRLFVHHPAPFCGSFF
jgi:predicted acetyltransferase